MNQLAPPDTHHLQAAIGWLELGNHLEANEELEKITASLRAHPDVLAVRWQIYACEFKWEACLDIAVALVQTDPKRADGWLHRSVSLYRLGRTQEAYDLLKEAATRFFDNWNVCYDLACYACQLGKRDEAWTLLESAFDLGEPKTVKLLALNDPDLESFWVEIGEI